MVVDQLEDFSARIANLSPEKRRMLEMRLAEKEMNLTQGSLARNHAVSLEPAGPADAYPVSSGQKRIYILQQLEENSIIYNMPGAIRMNHPLDIERIQKCFSILAERHETLRTSFFMQKGEVFQKIHPEVTISRRHQQGEVWEIPRFIREFIQPFQLSEPPLLRVGIFELSDGSFLLAYDLHHIIADGISMEILLREFVRLYQGETLPKLRYQYKDFAVWQAKLSATGLIEQQANYWMKKMTGEIPGLNLPTDFPRPLAQSFEGGKLEFTTGRELAEKVRKLAQENGVTVFSVLLSAYVLLLSRYTGQEDIIIGTPVTGRSHPDFANIIGMFVNTLTLRHFPTGDHTIQSFLKLTGKNVLEALENQDYQFEELVEKLYVKRDLSRNPLFDVMFTLQNAASSDFPPGFEPVTVGTGKVKFDLMLSVVEREGDFYFYLEYGIRLFHHASISRMAGYLLYLLEQMTDGPYRALATLELLSGEEKLQLIRRFTGPTVEYGKEQTITSLFEKQVEQTPYHTAIICGGQEICYHDINCRANRLARLLRSNGIGPEHCVGIMLPRSIEMIVAIWGVLKAGAAYLPLDPGYPATRISYMLHNSGVRVILTRPDTRTELTSEWVTINVGDESLIPWEETNLKSESTGKHPAYILYTSGSTGKPKGVMIEHGALHNLINWLTQRIDYTPEKTILCLTSISFDIFVAEALAPMFRGMCVLIATDEEQLDPEEVSRLITKHHVEMFQGTPSRTLLMLKSEVFQTALRQVTDILVAGEAFPETLRLELMSRTKARIYNLYGPTETTVYSTMKELTETEEITIGGPIANTEIYVVDRHYRLLPEGIWGELCIGGDGLARGYRNQPDLTGERFIPNPFRLGTRMYRTGDLARYLQDGNIEYAGRIDHQVKIRGYRVELDEIKAALVACYGVREAVVAAKNGPDGKYLCAYCVYDQEPVVAELRGQLAKSLPDYMIPSFFIQMEQFPLSPNGKLDINALPGPLEHVQTGVAYVPPRNRLEERLVHLWEDILGTRGIGIDDNFFDRGGNSFKATVLMTRLRREFQIAITLREIFRGQTIRELVVKIQTPGAGTEIKPVEARAYYPVSSSQKRIFLASLHKGVGDSLNMPGVVGLLGNLDQERLIMALQNLAAHHDSLRTSFTLKDGEPVQIIEEHIYIPVETANVVGYRDNESIASLIAEESGVFIQPFDLTRAPLVRMKLLRLAPDYHLLFYDMHHIIADGVSMEIMIRDFFRFYQGEVIPPLRLQYKDFAVWRQEAGKVDETKQELFWLETFQGELPVLNFPTDFPRPPIFSYKGDSLSFTISRETTDLFVRLARETGVSLFMLLFAAYGALLYKTTGQEDLIIGTNLPGRPHPDLEEVMGMFINNVPIRTSPFGNLTFREYLLQVKQNLLHVYENQDYPYEKLLGHLKIKRDPGRNPLYDTVVTMQDYTNTISDFGEIKLKGYPLQRKIARMDLLLILGLTEDGIEGVLEYATQLFHRSRIQRFMEHFLVLLNLITTGIDFRLDAIEFEPYQRVADTEVLNHDTGGFDF